MKKIDELRDMLCEELDNITEQGEITTGSLDIIDKLTHSIKSIDTIIAMEESGYSNDDYDDYSRRYDDYSRRGSYARGRRNARRDSMGRYSRGKKGMAEKLEAMMGDTNDPKVRKALENALEHIEE